MGPQPNSNRPPTLSSAPAPFFCNPRLPNAAGLGSRSDHGNQNQQSARRQRRTRRQPSAGARPTRTNAP
eukprot:3821095-Lingulodinium_polyedra.AAC.1